MGINANFYSIVSDGNGNFGADLQGLAASNGRVISTLPGRPSGGGHRPRQRRQVLRRGTHAGRPAGYHDGGGQIQR